MIPTSAPLTRRGLLGGLAAAGLSAAAASPTPDAPAASRTLRVAFLTDCHLPEPPGQNARMAKVLDRVQNQPDPPDLLIFGGDNVMAVDGSTPDAAAIQFANWSEQVQAHLARPALSVIGNHDIVWKAAPAADPKAAAIATYKMPARYHQHQAGGWTFLLLDTYHADGCRIDDEQLAWLEQRLADGDGPVALVSHAPILTVTSFFEPKTLANGKYTVPVGWMVADVIRLRDLFLAHPRVKLALSGHMHQVDRVDFRGVTYLCGGAVSGNWWDPTPYLGFGPVYVMLDLFADGTARHEVVPWE